MPRGHRGSSGEGRNGRSPADALVEATDPKRCLQLADEADTRTARDEPVGWVHGLPVAVKDVIRVAGLACSGGSPVIRAVADDDATMVSRLRSEGAIVSGLTNVPEMGRGWESNNNLYGRTNNPYDLSRTPGGSSGGSAALVAAGGAALSVFGPFKSIVRPTHAGAAARRCPRRPNPTITAWWRSATSLT